MAVTDVGNRAFAVRPYERSDRPALRARLLGAEPDEFGLHAGLVRRHPRIKVFFADGFSHYYDLEPESSFVADANDRIIGNLFGAVDTTVMERCEVSLRTLG